MVTSAWRRWVTAAAVAAATAVPAAGQQPKATAPQNESIRGAEMAADIAFISSDLMKGRLTGSPEVQVVAEYVRARFERLGLKPVGPGNSYNQPFQLMRPTLGDGNRLQVEAAGARRGTRSLRPGQEFYPQRFSASAIGRGEVVFAGFGIRPEDYGTEMAGKVALVLDHEPGEFDPNSPFDGVVSSAASDPIRKAWLAQQAGAVGILFVDDVHNHPGTRNFEASFQGTWPATAPRVERWTLAAWADRVTIPAAQITPKLAAEIANVTDDLFGQWSALSEKVLRPKPTGTVVELTASVDRHLVPTRNIVGLLEGADPKLKDEWIVVCAHHDHNGSDGGPNFYPGADDDASGVAAVMDIAEAYALAAAAGQRPKRSILFASWDAEERGLLGAWAYTEAPLAPLAKTVAVLNLDMIARNESTAPGDGRFRALGQQTDAANANTLNVLGQTRFPWILGEIEKANQPFGLSLKTVLDNNASQLLRRSDHWPFLNRGVTAVWFLTGLHVDYHTIYDRTERLNVPKMERVARLVHQLSWTLAEQGRPAR